MATLPTKAQQAFPQDGEDDARTGNPPQADPFWQATPRTNPSTLTTLMNAIQQVVPQSAPARQSRPPAAVRARVAACTHMTMCRLYTSSACQQCGKPPRMGWLYACRQDSMPPSHNLSVSDSLDSLPTVADGGSYFEAQAKVAASIGMSASVIEQIRSGDAYTYDQIETLLAQRRHVIDTIRCTTNPSTASVPPTPKRSGQLGYDAATDDIIASVATTAGPVVQKFNVAALPMTPAGTPTNTPADSQAGTPAASTSQVNVAGSSRKRSAAKGFCSYEVCPTCRPFFHDRIHMSFEPALNNEVPALQDADTQALPVQDANIVSNLGLLRHIPPQPLRRSEESMDITMHQTDGTGYNHCDPDTSTDWTPTTATTGETESGVSEKFDLSPCPGAGVCQVYRASEGCACEHGFEDGRHESNHGYISGDDRLAHGLGIGGTNRMLRHMPDSLNSTPDRTSSNGSSISLPNPPTTPLTVTASTVDLSGTPVHASSKAATYPDRIFTSLESGPLPHRSSPSSAKSTNSSSSRGSEVEVTGGVALTEEAVGSGLPDIAVG